MGVTKVVQETTFVTCARFWAGSCSLCETNPAHNGRGRPPSPSVTAAHTERHAGDRAARRPLPRLARAASAWRTFAVRRDSGFPTPSELSALDVVVRRRDGQLVGGVRGGGV